MTILNSLLFLVVGTLLTLKVALLAAAAILFVNGLSRRLRQRARVSAPLGIKARRTGVDEYA